MTKIPRIGLPGESDDFHDSRLLDVRYDPVEDVLSFTVLRPEYEHGSDVWIVELRGVLRFEFETVGSGLPRESKQPPEVYSIYQDTEGEEYERWHQRFKSLDERPDELFVVVFASSFLRGWGGNENLDGLRVVCRSIRVREP